MEEKIIKVLIEDEFAKENGIYFSKLEGDNLVFKMPIKSQHRNPLGLVHGAVLFALADEVSGYFCSQVLEKPSVTLSSSINYIKGSQAKEIQSETRLIQNTSSISLIEVSIFDENKELLAICNMTYYKLKNFEEKRKNYETGR
ncbi:PaaI family thioesterase [Peptoniphilus sp. GNH]|nr:hypothetical protein HMPREF3189_00704 [Clostridiales bacterium KA00134]UHR02823.1 PaaI family thioesterase [Peptoniphilus sp. GNH]